MVAHHRGDQLGAQAYSGQLHQVREHYLRRVRYYYQAQTRWPQAHFWRLRRNEALRA
ncbi:hypothetical protein D3C81_2339960 [compost metagenome]